MMHSRVKVLVILITALIVLTGIERVYADQEVPDKDYSLVTSNNEFVFVMFVPDEEIKASIEALNDTSSLPKDLQERFPSPHYTSVLDFMQREGLGINKDLRKKYPCSGLYRNDGSDLPIWTADWYSRGVFVHPDGKHLIRIGRWPRLKSDGNGHILYDELAIAFYRNGTELEKYTVQDLVANPDLLPSSVSHYEWRKDISFDEATGILSVLTATDETYEFNVLEMLPESNEKVTSCNPNDLYKYTQELNRKLLFVLIAIPILLVGVVLWSRKIIKTKG